MPVPNRPAPPSNINPPNRQAPAPDMSLRASRRPAKLTTRQPQAPAPSYNLRLSRLKVQVTAHPTGKRRLRVTFPRLNRRRVRATIRSHRAPTTTARMALGHLPHNCTNAPRKHRRLASVDRNDQTQPGARQFRGPGRSVGPSYPSTGVAGSASRARRGADQRFGGGGNLRLPPGQTTRQYRWVGDPPGHRRKSDPHGPRGRVTTVEVRAEARSTTRERRPTGIVTQAARS